MHFKKMVNSLKGLFFLGALLLLLTFSASNTFADFYVIAGSRGVGTKITALPYTISSPGFYFIAKDLSCAAGNHGIEITANNVTLDLMGFSLVGPGGSGFNQNGIFMSGRTNIEIRNGTVRNFLSTGIREHATFSEGHRIINVRVKDNGSMGIGLAGPDNLIEKCTVVGNGHNGIYTGSASTVAGNTCNNNTIDGINTGAASTVTGNTCCNNTQRGIFVNSGSTVTGNTCNENGNNGVYTFGTGFTVTGNTCFNNGHHGIYADVGSTVIGNTCCNNTSQFGIYLEGHNFVDQNTAYGNGTNMNDCTDCTFGSNHAPAP